MSHTNSPLLKSNSLTRIDLKGSCRYETSLVPRSKSHHSGSMVPVEHQSFDDPLCQSVPDDSLPAYSEIDGDPVVVAKSVENRTNLPADSPESNLYIGDDNSGERENWDKKAEFLLAVIGFAVDLGNVWRFPYICYRNGGGAFLVPYVIMLIFGGFPLFYLELALGQYYRSGCMSVWEKVCPLIKGVGYAICIIDFYVAIFYNTIIAWAVYYLIASFRYQVPWMSCDNEWNTKNCTNVFNRSVHSSNVQYLTSPAKEYHESQVLGVSKSTGLDDLGQIQWPISLCLLAVFVIVYFSLWKGVKSSGKAVWVTAILPYIVLFILLCRGITLEGSAKGILFYLRPEWSRLKKMQVWVDAATQIFFSLGPGFGTVLTLSSYNKFHNNCFRDAVVTSAVNSITSFIAGFAMFSILGYMAHVQGKDKVEDVTDADVALVFLVYPEAISTMTGSTFWSICFFLMLITLGLDSTFGGIEAVITGLCDEYPKTLKKHREWLVLAVLVVIYICSLPTTTFGGKYLISVLEMYGPSVSLLFVVFIESVAVCWIYGVSRFSDNIESMLGPSNRPGKALQFCWIVISPLFIFAMFVLNLINFENISSKEYPWWTPILGWLMTCSSLICIPAYMVYRISITPGRLKDRILINLRPVCTNVIQDIKRNENIVLDRTLCTQNNVV